MATSGTVSATVFETRRIIDLALGACKMKPQQITGEMIDQATSLLYLWLVDLSLDGAPLWTIEKIMLPLYDNVANIPLPIGTYEMKAINYRTPVTVSNTFSYSAPNVVCTFGTPTVATSMAIQWSSSSVPIALNVFASPDGVTFTQLNVTNYVWPVAQGLTGQLVWYDLDGCPVNTQYLRLVPQVSTQNLSGISAVYTYGGQTNTSGQTEIPLAVLNRDDYFNLPNKTFNNRPLQFWFDRAVPTQYLRTWSVPSGVLLTNCLVAQRQRYVQDVGSLSQTIECTPHWYKAAIDGLAVKCNRYIPDTDPSTVAGNIAAAAESLTRAWGGEQEPGPLTYTPQIGCYTK